MDYSHQSAAKLLFMIVYNVISGTQHKKNES